MMHSALQLSQAPAELPSHVLRHPYPNCDHGFDLPVAILGHGTERDAHDVILIDFQLGDQIDVKGGCALVEDEDRLFRGSQFSNARHAASYGFGEWRDRRSMIDEWNRRAGL